MRVIVIVIFITLLCIIDVSNARGGIIPHKFSKNLNKAIINTCTLRAFNRTNNKEVYDRIKNNYNNCSILANYVEFRNIRQSCIEDARADCGFGIVIAIMIWVVLAICSSTNK